MKPKRTRAILEAAILVAVIGGLAAAAWRFWNTPPPQLTALPIPRSSFIEAFQTAQPRLQILVNPGLVAVGPNDGGLTNLVDHDHHLTVTISGIHNQIDEATISLEIPDRTIEPQQIPFLELFLQMTVTDRKRALSWVRDHTNEAFTVTPRTTMGDRDIWLFSVDGSQPEPAARVPVLSVNVRRSRPR